jgi:phage terminase small subunit
MSILKRLTSKRAKAKPIRKAGSSKDSAEMRRILFVEAFMSSDENVTAAALAAGFSPKSAASQGSRLLKHVKTQTLLNKRRAELVAKFQLTTEAVLKNLAQALYFDPRKMFREDGSLKAIHELDDDTAQALAGFEVTEEFSGRGEARGLSGYTKKVKWLDKNSARDQAMKHFGQYMKDNKQVGEAAANALGTLLAGMQKSSLPVVADPDA